MINEFLISAVVTFFAFAIGVPLGFAQAAWRARWPDRAATMVTAGLFAAPAFWVALALVAVFTYGAAVVGLPMAWRLPALGVRSPGLDLSGYDWALAGAPHAPPGFRGDRRPPGSDLLRWHRETRGDSW